MIAMIEEDWGVSEQGTGEYQLPEKEHTPSWLDRFVDYIFGLN